MVAVRNDLKLSPGKMAVQVAHAAVSCTIQCEKREKELFDAWYREGQRKVVVKAQGIDEIYLLKEIAYKKGVIFSVIEDAGLTEIPPGTVTCIGIGPGREEEIDPITRRLPLM
ncbi:MAG: peptidyl-tRNA hydrolase Pth2 [Methanomassiliicoccales archaeon]